jgi:tetratricopeptide (TPR) repeat protein
MLTLLLTQIFTIAPAVKIAPAPKPTGPICPDCKESVASFADLFGSHKDVCAARVVAKPEPEPVSRLSQTQMATIVVPDLDPKASEEALKRGRKFVKDGKTDDALRILREAVNFDPKNVEALVLRARVLCAEQRWAEAVSDATRATTMDTQCLDGWILQARSHLQQGQFEAVLVACTEGEKVDAKNAELLSLRKVISYV